MGDLIINVSDTPVTPPSGNLDQMTFSNPPTLAEVERLYTERWHTRPAWLYDGTFASRNIVGVDPLPTGAVYNAGENRITIPTGVTIADFSGWDFLETQTTILMEGTARIINFTNNRLCPRFTTKANRIAHNQAADPPVPFQFEVNSTARVDNMIRCQFTQHPLHEGTGGPGSFLRAQTTGGSNSFAKIDLLEFCSFEGYDSDAVKGSWAGVRRYCYFDPARGIPNDATLWDDQATYQAGDVVYGNTSSAQNSRIRLCLNNNVTSAPNFSGTTTSTADWLALDPHHDCDQPTSTPQNESVDWWGSVFIRDYRNRRFPSVQNNRGVVNALRYVANTSSQDIGPMDVQYCLFSDEFELQNSNSEAIAFPSAARSYSPVTQKVARNNWYQTRFSNNPGSHVTVSANISGYTFPTPATLSAVSATYGSGALTYNFTPSKGGWMRIVITSSSTGLTAANIVNARDGDSGVLGIFEIDSDGAATSGSFTLASSGTVYAQAVYQHGGGNFTLAPVQTVAT